MHPCKALIAVITLAALLATASPSYANISNAAVLFLRIAPGARAAAMGESFVAIADDATATHWNPAGLGAYPMASTWIDASVPADCRPLKSMVALKSGSGAETHLGFDIWAIGSKGVMRYDNKRWYTAEVFSTRTDQTVPGIVSKYFNTQTEERTNEVVSRVAVANSRMSYDSLASYLTAVQTEAPKGFKDTAALRTSCDSLLALYPLCRINWDRIADARGVWTPGTKAGSVSARDMDRVFFSLEHARNRFIPEDLQIPYEAIFQGTPTAIASTGEVLFVGTTKGLITYTGRSWRTFTEADGMPSSYVTSLAALSATAVVGTANGAVLYDGVGISKFKDTVGLPADTVFAVAAPKAGDYYAVVNKDLYHWDGLRWTNTVAYTVAVDDSQELIASKFALYGSLIERQKYLEKLLAIPQNVAAPAASLPAAPKDSAHLALLGALKKDTGQVAAVVPTPADSAKGTDTTSGQTGATAAASPFVPGHKVVVPYLAEIKGQVTSMQVVGDAIWIGTEYGVMYFDKNRWHFPGYRDTIAGDSQTISDLVAQRKGASIDPAKYAQALRDLNDLSSDTLTAGQKIKVRTTPAAAYVNNLAYEPGCVLVATSEGMLQYTNSHWERYDVHGMGTVSTQGAFACQDELWLATGDRVVTKGRSKSEVTLMHVKWLPELASDLYYDFASIVGHIEGLGTVGGNITFISYGSFSRTNDNPTVVGTFESFDIAATVSYGTSLTNTLKGGISAKIIYSRLSDQGAGAEQGSGTSTGFALDAGLLWQKSSRLNIGVALTNLGPKMAYIDAAQADPLPANLAVGFAYKLKQADYLRVLVTMEANKLLPGTNSSITNELKEVVLNGGAEIVYANIIAGRVGYIYDQEGQIKTVTLGAGLSLMKRFRFDFAYIPSNSDVALANTMRISLAVGL